MFRDFQLMSQECVMEIVKVWEENALHKEKEHGSGEFTQFEQLFNGEICLFE